MNINSKNQEKIDRKFTRAILHFDGDSFFASVEQVMNHKLKGKVVITGGERGAITSVSVEGKKLGIGRGLSLKEARMKCPDLVIVSSDYTSYSIFAHRMYTIVREFTDKVEEYSIDECFADITDLDTEYNMSYEEIALMIKKKLETSLGVTFGVGLAPTKVLAKVASKHRKPAGFTSISKPEIESFLLNTPVEKVWGIGASTSVELSRLGIVTALDFTQKDMSWFERNKFAKPHKEIWSELRGDSVKELNMELDDKIGSIISSRTFAPPSKDRNFILSQLSKNIEQACIKIRRHKGKARHIRFYLKTQEFMYKGLDISLSIPLSTPAEIMTIVDQHFDQVYRSHAIYRATGISLSAIVPEDSTSADLFGESVKNDKSIEIFSIVDKMSHKYGQHTLFLASSLDAFNRDTNVKIKDTRLMRRKFQLSGERYKKTIDIPFLGIVK